MRSTVQCSLTRVRAKHPTERHQTATRTRGQDGHGHGHGKRVIRRELPGRGRSEGAGNRTTGADGLFEFEDADAAVAVEMTRSRLNRGDEKKNAD